MELKKLNSNSENQIKRLNDSVLAMKAELRGYFIAWTPSAYQRTNTSTHQHINTSTHLHSVINTTHQHINTNTSTTHQHINTSTHSRIQKIFFWKPHWHPQDLLPFSTVISASCCFDVMCMFVSCFQVWNCFEFFSKRKFRTVTELSLREGSYVLLMFGFALFSVLC